MSARVKLFLSGVGLFLFFVFFSYLVHKDLFTQFDFNTTVHLQDNISRRFDDVFSFLSDVGKFEVMSVVLVIITVFLFVKKRYLAAFCAWVLFVGFHLIELFGKYFVDHLPPPQFMLRTKEIVQFPQFHVRSEFSYPSGHAGRTAFLSVIIIIFILQQKRLSRPVKIVLCLIIVGYDIAMFISRPYLGEHWMSDVIGGAILGLAFGLITGGLMIKQKHTSNKPSVNS